MAGEIAANAPLSLARQQAHPARRCARTRGRCRSEVERELVELRESCFARRTSARACAPSARSARRSGRRADARRSRVRPRRRHADRRAAARVLERHGSEPEFALRLDVADQRRGCDPAPTALGRLAVASPDARTPRPGGRHGELRPPTTSSHREGDGCSARGGAGSGGTLAFATLVRVGEREVLRGRAASPAQIRLTLRVV